jgi:hypothetical protein
MIASDISSSSLMNLPTHSSTSDPLRSMPLVFKHLNLTILRQIIAVLRAQDVNHQRGVDKALGNGAAWYLDLNEPLAAGAGQTWAGDLIYDVVASQ